MKYSGVVGVFAVGLATGWFVWALLRAVSTRQHVRLIERPPMCETCGYNLSVAPMEGRCSECGVPVVESLGPQARPGPVWERRGQVGRLRAWWRCWIDPLIRPLPFGRQVRVRPTGRDWKSMLRLNLAGMGLIGVSTFVWFGGLVPGWNSLASDCADAATAAVAVGFFTGLFSLLWMIAAAGLVGLAARVLYGRNLLPAAMQNAAYLGGYMVVAGLVWMGSVTAVVVIVRREHLFLEQLQALGAWESLIEPLAVMGSMAVGLLVYMALLFRATSGARYANH